MHVFGGPSWWKDTCPHLLISGECRGRFSTTTRSWRWPRFWGGGNRKKTRAFCELQSYCLFKEKFGRPGKGNDKGKVEGLVGYARRNFLVPIPRVGSWENLNTHLREQAESNESGGCAGRKRRLGNASSATAPC